MKCKLCSNFVGDNYVTICAALRYYALKEQHEADARIAAIVRDCDDETRIREIREHFSLGRSHNERAK